MAIFAVSITFGDAAKRDEVRPTHREFLKAQFDAGRLVESGPYVDDTGALLIYEAETEADVQAILERDPYWRAGSVVASVQIKEWNRVFSRC
ncbi:MAG: YciI family protein [Chloroflexota bacterium]|nr:YciI family protein [Chloroflexota bacterium]